MGLVTARREVKIYRRTPVNPESDQKDEIKTTFTDPIEYNTTAFWLDIAEKVLSGCGIPSQETYSTIHAVEHAVRTVFPLVADIDPGDLGSTIDVESSVGDSFRCRFYVFDSFAGGTGLSEFAFIWINEGKFYESKQILRNEMKVEVRHVEDRVNYLTMAMPSTTLTCHEDDAKIRRSRKCTLGMGLVTARREVKIYRRTPVNPESDQKDEIKTTFTDPIEYNTTAFWLDIAEKVLSGCGIPSQETYSTIHAVEHAVRTVFPLVADIDPGDLGSTIDVESSVGDSFRCRFYVFDSFAGGTGLSEFAFEKPGVLLNTAYELLVSCNCDPTQGCPRCTIISWCEFRNQELNKGMAQRLLKHLKDIK